MGICLNPVGVQDIPYLFCSIYLDISCESLPHIINDFQSKTGNFHQETIKINNILATKLTGQIKNISVPIDEALKKHLVGLKKIDVHIPYNNDIYSFHYTDVNGNFEKKFDKILSTFEFIQSKK